MTPRSVPAEGGLLGRGTFEAVQAIVVWIGRACVILVPLVLWQVAADRGVVDTFAYSEPTEIWARTATWVADGTIVENLATTLQNAFVGYLTGTLLGTATAILFVLYPRLGRIYTPVMTVANAIPGFALTPLLIAAFGFGSMTAISLVTIVVLFVAFFSVLGGLRSVGDQYTAWAKTLGASEVQVWWTVRIPAIVGWLIASLRIMVGLAFSAAIVSEFVGGGQGIGYLVSRSMNVYDSTGVFAGIFVIVIIVGLVDNIIRLLEQRGTRWIGFA